MKFARKELGMRGGFLRPNPDYPHRDGFFPVAPQLIKDRMAGASLEVRHQVLAGGAMGFYGLN
jgi:hypothetical protein